MIIFDLNKCHYSLDCNAGHKNTKSIQLLNHLSNYVTVNQCCPFSDKF